MFTAHYSFKVYSFGDSIKFLVFLIQLSYKVKFGHLN